MVYLTIFSNQHSCDAGLPTLPMGKCRLEVICNFIDLNAKHCLPAQSDRVVLSSSHSYINHCGRY